MAKKTDKSAYGTELMFNKIRSNHPIRSRYMAAVLAIVFGFLGIHHFYLNNIVKGILMLLFSAVCIVLDIFGLFQFKFIVIPIAISILTGFIYLLKSDVKFAKSNHIRTI